MEKHLKKVLFLVIWFLIHIPNNSADEFCGDNESYVLDTSLPTCESTCSNRNLHCIEGVIGWEGCRCDSGYMRNSNGNCVAEEDCDLQDGFCGANEFFSASADDGRDCEATCRVRGGICDGQHKNGCYCDDGYLRNSKGLCVLESDC